MSIQRLLGENSGPFIDQYFQKLPYSRPGGGAALCELATWDVLTRLLRLPDLDSMVVRKNEKYVGAFPTSSEQARLVVEAGYTILIKQAQRHDERLAELARGFERDFAAAVDIHLYCTPADQFGFSWHYDAEEVFIVQTTGKKEYTLRKNTVNPWPLEETLPANMHYEREIMPQWKCLLSAGDWLYIPSGYWHRGAASEMAISLAIGVMPRTGIDLYDRLRSKLIESLAWRQRLPVLGEASTQSDAELEATLAALASQLADDFVREFRQPAFLRSFIEQVGSESRISSSDA